MGRLTRDPETRYSQNENSTAIAHYSLAVDRRGGRNSGGNEPQADFFNITAFGKSGEFAEKYFKKGMRVLVSGRLQNRSYTNKDGQKVNVTEIIAEDQEFADGKNSGAGSAQGGGTPSSVGEGFMNIPDDLDSYGDIPFV